MRLMSTMWLATVLLATVAEFTISCSASNHDEGAVSVNESHLAADAGNVWTQHYDNSRTGTTLNETVLNTSNVNPESFGKLFTRSVDDQIYAQPLILLGVTIAGNTHNVVYVATVNNTIYAFDADDPASTAPLARRSLIDVAPAGTRPVRNTDVGQNCVPYLDFSGNLGIVGTPVIDIANDTLYVVSRLREPDGFVQRLHALNVSTLAERPGSPVVISASVPGGGAGSVGGRVLFNSQTENQRAALLLSNGTVFIAWASHCDTGPYHGWVLGYDAQSLAQVLVFNDTPDGEAGGIWQAGQGLAADSSGLLYFVTGNGTSNAPAGGQSYGSAFVKLNPTLSAPVVDWFMPYNVDRLNETDTDLGSSGALLLPGSNYLLGGSKEGYLYLLDRDDLGHFQADSNSQILQSFLATAGHIHGSPVYWNSHTVGPTIYVWSEYDVLKAFSFDGNRFNTIPRTGTIHVPNGMPGGMLSLSANGDSAGTGLIWAAHPSSGDANHETQPGILRAIDAENVSHELWNSNMNAARDALGSFAKFVSPVVTNGKVYAATFSSELVVYGVLPSGGNEQPGTGLLAEYFSATDMAVPVLTRAEPTIDFDWGLGSPDPTISPDSFSARWTGQILPQYSEMYSFTTTSDDGVRLWVNGTLVINNWTDHPRTNNSGSLALVAGRKYDLKMEFYENWGHAVARLLWSSPSQALEIVPSSRLYPASGSGTGLRAEYFDELEFGGAAIARIDPSVNFDWGVGSPDPAISADTFSARWTGRVLPRFTETYRFIASTDDGVRLWINGALLIDNWIDHARMDNSGTIPLVAGNWYDVRMEYYERFVDAVAVLSWSSPSQTREVVPPSQLYPAPQ